jgi:hypothetical protein
MTPEALNSLFSLCIGFALAGALTSGFQAVVQRPAMMATVLAGFWSLMSGTFFLMTLRAAGLLA